MKLGEFLDMLWRAWVVGHIDADGDFYVRTSDGYKAYVKDGDYIVPEGDGRGYPVPSSGRVF